MKIVEAQSATLTNFEVDTFIKEQRRTYGKRKGPSNYETIIKELEDYLAAPPSPLRDRSLQWSDQTIVDLLTQLRPYELTKAEILMIINHRPAQIEHLDTIIQEFSIRIPDEEEQQKIAEIVRNVLGSPDVAAEREEMEDALQKGKTEDKQRQFASESHMTADSTG